MDEAATNGYTGLPTRIREIGTRLQVHADEENAEDVRLLLELVDEFHRVGLARLVETILAWRGEIFLDALERDLVVKALLGAYQLPPPEMTN